MANITGQDMVLHGSNLDTLINIFNQLLQIARQKQERILQSDWDFLTAISSKQNETSIFLNKAIQVLDTTSSHNDKKLKAKRENLQALIKAYKEVEEINIKLLDDQLYIARKKTNMLLKKTSGQKTYSPDKNREAIFKSDRPVILSEII